MSLRRLLIFAVFAPVLALLIAGPTNSGAQAAQEKVPVLISFSSNPGASEQALVRRAGGDVKYTYRIIPAISASLPQSAIDGLSRNPRVTRIEADIEVHAVGQTLPWGVDRVDAQDVHATNTGVGVKVAVMDTGIDMDHPDLSVAGGVTFTGGRNADDKNGHGSHVAGTIAGQDNGIGVLGIAPDVSLYAIKVLGNGGTGNYSDVIAGLQWAIANGIQVTNSSFGSGANPGQAVEDAFIAAKSAGIVNVAAAGNENGSPVIYPAAYDSVIAVSATTNTDAIAGYSNKGPKVDLAAPGSSIYSTYKGGGYATLSGTSMASPHVAGVAALVVASGITDPDLVKQQLTYTAEDLGATGKDNLYGYGLVDAENAVLGTTSGDNYVGGGSPPDPGDGGDPGDGSGGTGDMGVYDISWGTKRHLDIGVNIRQDSDSSGTLTGSDISMSGAVVSMTLAYDSNGDGAFDCAIDSCWNFLSQTDSSGNVAFKLLFAPNGNYQAEVTDLTHSTEVWNSALDADNPDTFTR